MPRHATAEPSKPTNDAGGDRVRVHLSTLLGSNGKCDVDVSFDIADMLAPRVGSCA